MVNDNKINNQRFIYPEQDDENIISKIYQKREFHYHKIPKREKLKNYEEIQKYRDGVCKNKYKPRPQQAIGSNLMNPNTPVNGLLVMHGTGTGKTCVAIGIAEQFKEQVLKYNTKIYVVVPGPNTRENFKGELLYCTGDTYMKNKDSQRQLRTDEIERENEEYQAAVTIASTLDIERVIDNLELSSRPRFFEFLSENGYTGYRIVKI